MKNENTIHVSIKIDTKISLWDAIKLRIAGADFINKLIEQKLKKP